MTGRRSREEQREETRRRLRDAGAEVIAERGLDGASIDEITERAGYTRGAFYSNFASKDELLIAICDERIDRQVQAIVPQVRAAPECERVSVAARLLTDPPEGHDVLLLVELGRLRRGNTDAGTLLDGFLTRLVDRLDEILATSFETVDEVPADARRLGARALLGALFGLSLLRHLGVDHDVAIAELLLGGVGAAAFPDLDLSTTSTTENHA